MNSISQKIKYWAKELPVVILFMALAVIAAKRYLRYSTPMYESAAKIKLADNHDGVPNSNLYKDFDLFSNTNKISAEVELIKSKVLVGKAITQLDIGTSIYRVGDIKKIELYKQSPVIVNTRFTNVSAFDKRFSLSITKDSLVNIQLPDGSVVTGKMNSIFHTNVGEIAVIKNTAAFNKKPYLQLNDRYEFIVYSDNALINNIIANMDVMPADKDVPVVRISYKSADAEKSADVVNAIAATYIADYIDEKFKSADTTSDFLQRELGTYRNRLSSSERNIESYRNKENIINIRQETETDLRKIADLKKQEAALQMRMIAVDSLNNYVRQSKVRFDSLAPNYEAFTDLLSTEMIKKVKELQREKRDLLNKYTPGHEYVQATDDKIKTINSYLVESIRNTSIHLHNQYDDLQRTISEAEKKFIGLPTREKTMTILERQFSLDEKIYCFLHEKKTEAEIAKAAKISFHRIISQGEIPRKPVSPNAAFIIPFAGFLGLLLGLALIYIIRLLRGNVQDVTAIHHTSSVPVAASIPFLKKKAGKDMFFRKWMFEMLLKQYFSGGKVMTVSSFDEDEGKRFITANIAGQLRQNGIRTLLVDVDGTMEKKPGIDHIDLTIDIIQWDHQSTWNQLIEKWRSQYDVVLIKNAALSDYPSALLPMSNTDVNLFVLDSCRTKKNRITEAELMQEELQLPHVQFVLNRAGYAPGILQSIYGWIKQLFRR